MSICGIRSNYVNFGVRRRATNLGWRRGGVSIGRVSEIIREGFLSLPVKVYFVGRYLAVRKETTSLNPLGAGSPLERIEKQELG